MSATHKGIEPETGRRYVRHAGNTMVSFQIEPRGTNVRGVLLNWSAAGAGILLETPCKLPNQFLMHRVSHAQQNVAVRCMLKWQDGVHAGVKFTPIYARLSAEQHTVPQRGQ